MTIEVIYVDGTEGSFGPFTSFTACDKALAALAKNPRVRSARRNS